MNNSNRWWELYIVRYAIGTVVGAMCVYFILHTLGTEAKALWLMQPDITKEHIGALVEQCKQESNQACIVQAQLTQDLYGFNLAQLILLGIYGLAYTYFASAPVLVIHAIRRILLAKKAKSEDESQTTKPCLVLGILIFIGSLLLIFGGAVIWQIGWLNVAILSLASAYLLLQLILLACESRNASALLAHYKKLHTARESKCIETDSYKHLREHGNAFLLVVHNVMLLGVVFAISQTFGAEWILLAILWIFPAAGVYMLGHKIEAEMIKDSDCEKKPKITESKSI